MALITFTQTVSFPIATLRDRLTRELPFFRWQCGAQDRGGRDDSGAFAEAGLIIGRAGDTVIFTELTAHDGPCAAPAPPHAWHLVVGRPTIDTAGVADRIIALTCAVVMAADPGARCRLAAGAPWLTGAEVEAALDRVLAGKPLIDLRDVPAAMPMPPTPARPGGLAAPAPPARGFGRKGL